MSETEQSIADALTANIAERRNWDEPAQAYWIYLSKGRTRLAKLPAINALLRLSRPAVVLATLAQAASDRRSELRRSIPAELCGAAFFSEAWTVQYDSPEEIDEAVRNRETEPLSQHSRRVEQRGLFAVDRSGRHYVVTQVRGEDIQTKTEQAGGTEHEWSGSVLTSLDRLLTAALGVEIR
ncbi:Uncharacterised protein [Mycobacteroides abscessus subsp. abscessus]|uniref:hypothetical protein n=1 Tax=Mycobacteroides abscessus TaxID=36809 RepID=UPI0009279648|nr:hypothetical protein [Mycobacteroides abscessus]SHX97306.1 Uncharacterised protein [Mycobacteroides abscessus subsp. abscessus]SIC78512.1 Uncharacterised protein [Mycobacteroides abscessus subsp. abscessus]SKP27142.1 Uncharacterised protein [Mycobacteroides abscessus subsp. abscessus]